MTDPVLNNLLRQKLIAACLDVASSRASRPSLIQLCRLVTTDICPKLPPMELLWPECGDQLPAHRMSTDVPIRQEDLFP